MSTAIQKLDAVEIGKRLDAEITAMPSDQLAEHVRDGIGGVYFSMAMIAPYIQELWRRFETLRAGESISGCRTKKEYCETVLNRTPRAVRYMLAGGNPVSKRNPSKEGETVSPVIESTLAPEKPAPVPPELQESDDFAAALQALEDKFPGAIRLIQTKGAVIVTDGKVDLKYFSLDPEPPADNAQQELGPKAPESVATAGASA